MSGIAQEPEEKTYPYPVYGTQGGGLAKAVGNTFVFVEKPDCPGLGVGDTVPEMWGIVPANRSAHEDCFLEGDELEDF